MVVTDSVAKQLDGLKKDPALTAAVRRFWSHGLDACGPAGDLPPPPAHANAESELSGHGHSEIKCKTASMCGHMTQWVVSQGWTS